MRDDNANDFVKSCYDIIMELTRSIMLKDGFNASGRGAHEAEVSYLKLRGLKEVDIQFVNQLRYFRNGVIYYGEGLDRDYALLAIEKTKKLYVFLSNIK